MDKVEELTATDKLLQVIKGKSGNNGQNAHTSPAPPEISPKNKKSRTGFFRKEKKTVQIGIDIGDSHLRLVKAGRKSSNAWAILDTASFALPEATSKAGPSYQRFIGEKIRSFCNIEQSDLWAVCRAENFEVRHLRIPKLPRKEISNAVHWTFKKAFPFDENEFRMDYMIRDEVMVGGDAKLSVLAYIVPNRDINETRELFRAMGLELSGLTILPFAIRNVLNCREGAGQDTLAVLDIGEESSRIDIHEGGNLALTRIIKAGTMSMAEALHEGWLHQGRACIYEDALNSLKRLEAESAGTGLSAAGDEREQILELLTPALERMIRQAERTFDFYGANYGGGPIRTLLVSGALYAYEPLARRIETQLGLSCQILDPSGLEGLPNQSPLARVDLAERVALIPAIGAACSDVKKTPNLIYGYLEKDAEASVKKLNKAVMVGFLALIALCGMYFINQNVAYSQKKEDLKKLESRLAAGGSSIDRQMLLEMAGRIQRNRTISRSYAERYRSVAIIGEMALITPEEIKLTRLDITPAAVAGDAKTEAGQSEITIEGIIQGDRSSTESILTGYTFRLDSSPLFEKITVRKSDSVPFIGREAMQFIINAKIS